MLGMVEMSGSYPSSQGKCSKSVGRCITRKHKFAKDLEGFWKIYCERGICMCVLQCEATYVFHDVWATFRSPPCFLFVCLFVLRWGLLLFLLLHCNCDLLANIPVSSVSLILGDLRWKVQDTTSYLFILLSRIIIRQCKHFCWLSHLMVLKFLTHTHTQLNFTLWTVVRNPKVLYRY